MTSSGMEIAVWCGISNIISQYNERDDMERLKRCALADFKKKAQLKTFTEQGKLKTEGKLAGPQQNNHS